MALIHGVTAFAFDNLEIQKLVPDHTDRELMGVYKEKLVTKVAVHGLCKLFLPAPLKAVKAAIQSVHFLREGIRCLAKRKLEVPVLDATVIGVSLLRRDITTAGSVMFLLGIGEILEEWTHKKSVADLAQSMSLNVEEGQGTRSDIGSHGDHDSAGWDCPRGRGDGEPGFSHRGRNSGEERSGILCLCGNCGGGRRTVDSGETVCRLHQI